VILAVEPDSVAVGAGLWMHFGSMPPSEFELCLDPRLREAAEDRRFICVGYAVVLCAEAINLAQPRTDRVV
jgi:hypothetical protein